MVVSEASGAYIASHAGTYVMVTAAATVPWWREWLRVYSELAADLAPFIVVVLLATQLFKQLRADGPTMTAVNLKTPDGRGPLYWVATAAAAMTAVGALIMRLRGTRVPRKAPPARVDTLPRPAPTTIRESIAVKTIHKTPWFDLAKKEIGTKERAGKKNNPRVVAYYADAGHAGIKLDSVPWCAGFVGAMLERCGISSSKSLAARSYMTWGKALKKPVYGCVVVFRRGNSDWQGHVGFYVGETRTHVKVLGGNQGDAVNVRSYPKSKLLGYRWPTQWHNSRTVKTAALGMMGTASVVSTNLPAVDFSVIFELLAGSGSVADTLNGLGDRNKWFAVVGGVLALASHLAAIWIRNDDNSRKGK